MSVRLWLMEAECWQCGTRIEISESQRQQIEAATKTRTPVKEVVPLRVDLAQSSVPAAPQKQVPIEVRLPVKTGVGTGEEKRPAVIRLPKPPPVVLEKKIEPPPIQRRRVKKESSASKVLNWISIAPAWLVSLLAHLVLLLILALLTSEQVDDRGILLSLSLSPARVSGDIESLIRKEERAYDLPLPKQMNPDDPNVAGWIQEANKVASELTRGGYDKGFDPGRSRS